MPFDKAHEHFARFRAKCPYHVQPPLERRPGNALCLEIAQPMARCTLRPPAHWPESASTLRWLGSGGSPLVFGHCTMDCALGHRWCATCGHLRGSHDLITPESGCWMERCGCDAFVDVIDQARKLRARKETSPREVP